MDYIGVGWRAAAAIIDGVALFAIGYAVALVTGDLTATGFEIEGGPALAAFALWFVYYIVTEAMLGASIGKLLLGLRVVKMDGSPIDWPAAIARNVLRVVDGFILYLVGALLVWQSPRRQRLGDRIAGTVVVRARSAGASVAPKGGRA